MTSERSIPSRDEVAGYLHGRRNWGRWGEDDQRGTINLITDAKRVAAARLVRSGRTVSLSRPFPKDPGPRNPNPGQHFVGVRWKDEHTGLALDYLGLSHHGYSTTHIDALCHIWDGEGMWGGRDPREMVTSDGARWGGIEQWGDGIVTRGVLLDVPGFRGEDFVSDGEPVHGWELEDVARAQGVQVEPGDALVVFGGRQAWEASVGDWSTYPPPVRPGLHPSCLPFLRDHDVAVLVWDLMDVAPSDYGLMWGVHGAIMAYGLALVDNAVLEPLAVACAAEGRYEFQFLVAPLPVVGGTGCPVNPLAIF